MVRVALTAVCVSLGVLLSSADAGSSVAASATTGRQSCSRRGSKTILSDRHVRVFSFRDNDPDRGFTLSGCAYSVIGEYALDDPVERTFAFLPPAMTLSGTIVGYAYDLCGVGRSCDTTVEAVDLATEKSVNAAVAGAVNPVKVGSLRVRSDGALAWIACPEPNRHNADASRAPNCIRAGALDSVYRAGAGKPRQLLDRARRIDPSSLRLSGSTLSWLHAGHRRSAVLR